MVLKERLKNPAMLIRAGLVLLILAGAAKLWLVPGDLLTVDAADGLIGFLYGAAIASLLLGLWRQKRH